MKKLLTAQEVKNITDCKNYIYLGCTDVYDFINSKKDKLDYIYILVLDFTKIHMVSHTPLTFVNVYHKFYMDHLLTFKSNYAQVINKLNSSYRELKHIYLFNKD